MYEFFFGIKFDISIKCSFDESVQNELTNDDAQLIKEYLEFCRRNVIFKIESESANFLENEYSNLRSLNQNKTDSSTNKYSINEQKFHSLINLCRLRCISFGEVDISKSRWDETVEMYLNLI